MITDMERIGDQASDIAEIIDLNGRIGTDAQYICQMAVAAMRMVRQRVLRLAVKRDVAMAEATIQHDDVVGMIFLKGVAYSMISVNPKDEASMHLILMIAKYFERIEIMRQHRRVGCIFCYRCMSRVN